MSESVASVRSNLYSGSLASAMAVSDAAGGGHSVRATATTNSATHRFSQMGGDYSDREAPAPLDQGRHTVSAVTTHNVWNIGVGEGGGGGNGLSGTPHLTSAIAAAASASLFAAGAVVHVRITAEGAVSISTEAQGGAATGVGESVHVAAPPAAVRPHAEPTSPAVSPPAPPTLAFATVEGSVCRKPCLAGRGTLGGVAVACSATPGCPVRCAERPFLRRVRVRRGPPPL